MCGAISAPRPTQANADLSSPPRGWLRLAMLGFHVPLQRFEGTITLWADAFLDTIQFALKLFPLLALHTGLLLLGS